MELTVLAVTKREQGVCIAGVDEELNWIRPIKNRILVLNDVKSSEGLLLSNSCVYDLALHSLRPMIDLLFCMSKLPNAEDLLV